MEELLHVAKKDLSVDAVIYLYNVA